jgi:hypothetical protein
MAFSFTIIILIYTLKLTQVDEVVKKELFKESKTYSDKNLITEICVSMLLINNDFLSNILDKGIRGRYNENSQVFITDLKVYCLLKID